MAKQFMYNIQPHVQVPVLSDAFANNLAAMGYNVRPMMVSDVMATYSVVKVGSDVEKLAGMLPEFNITLTKNNDILLTNVEDVWASKIIACAVGLWFCGIGLITGLIGVSRQSSASGDIQQVLMSTISHLQ